MTEAERPRVLIVFYSRDGSVEALANAMAEGAESGGAEVRVRRVRELVGAEVMALAPGWSDAAERMNALYPAPTAEDVIWSEAICMGSPTRFGGASSELRGWLETLGGLWYGKKLLNKVGTAFASVSSLHGGLETTILGLYPVLAHLDMIIVPQGYGHPAAMTAGSPYGVGSISAGAARRPPTHDDRDLARYQGLALPNAHVQPVPSEAMLDPKLLQYFVEVADTASFSRAAERLNVTQSWLSRQVAKLEEQINFKLFDRTSRTVVLTERGRELLARAQPAVDHVRGVQALASKLARKESVLAIGIPTYALTTKQRLILCDRFLERYPQTRVDTRIDSYRHLETSLIQGELDLMFVLPVPGLLGNDQIEAITVAGGGIDVVFTRGDALERERAVTLEQLSKRRVSAFSKYSNGELFALLFEPAVTVGAEIAEYSDYSFYRNLSDQNAVTLMPSWQPLPSAKLDRRPLLDHDQSVDLACVRLRAHSHPALERFWALAQEMAATRLS